jgi:sugar lactone lactonase YvrE
MSRRRRILTPLVAAAALATTSMPVSAAAEPFPDVIPLPGGWRAEGVAVGSGTSVYAGSLADGAIWRGDLRTGEGGVLVPGSEGSVSVGLKAERGLLYVAGGPTGTATVYDADSGAVVDSFALADPGTSFVNDVTVTRDAAYFTNSFAPVFYRVDLGPAGVPTGDVEAVDLGGDWVQGTGFGANGIASTPDGKALIVVNSGTGTLYKVDPMTGEATEIDTGGVALTAGDGILLRGKTLYVVRNQLNEIAVLSMSPHYLSATLVDTLTDPDFDVPTTLAAHGTELYAVNARFGTEPTPETEYDIVMVDQR